MIKKIVFLICFFVVQIVSAQTVTQTTYTPLTGSGYWVDVINQAMNPDNFSCAGYNPQIYNIHYGPNDDSQMLHDDSYETSGIWFECHHGEYRYLKNNEVFHFLTPVGSRGEKDDDADFQVWSCSNAVQSISMINAGFKAYDAFCDNRGVGTEEYHGFIRFNANFYGEVFMNYIYHNNKFFSSKTEYYNMSVCVLAPSGNQPVAVTPSINVVAEGKSVYFNVSENGYCGYNKITQYKYVVHQPDGAIIHTQDWANLSNFGSHKQTNSYQFNFGGDHKIDVYLKDVENNLVYGPYERIIKVVPACANDADVSVDIVALPGVTPGPAPIIPTVGNGYVLEPNETYRVIFDGATNFDGYYELSEDGGVTGSTMTSTIEFESVNPPVNTEFNLKVTAPKGSFRINTTFVANTNSTNYCQQFDPLNIFVKGSDLTSKLQPCLVTLPADLPKVFDGLAFDFALDYTLEHFTHTINSNRGVVFEPDLNKSITLEAGALLFVSPPSDFTSSLELPDNNSHNWSKQRVFDEQNHVLAESKSYFDAFGNRHQTQSKNIEEGLVLASQTFYDNLNRPTLQTLGAPLRAKEYIYENAECDTRINRGEDLYFKFSDGFIKNIAGNTYSYKDFDGARLGNPNPVGEQGYTLGEYYTKEYAYRSEYLKNTFLSRTDYPFVQTVFKDDGTGDVLTVIPPGDIYRSPSDVYPPLDNGPSRTPRSTTETLTAADIALLTSWKQMYVNVSVSIAAAIVIDSKNFYKVTNTDANGADSKVTTYFNKSGNPVATYHDHIVKYVFPNNVVVPEKSYSFYDVRGNLISQVSPLGVQSYENGTPYIHVDKRTYQYDFQGNVIQTESNDEGKTEFLYRKDGLIRFSQNAKQENLGKFNYINYDRYNRPVESGEVGTFTGVSNPWDEVAEMNIENETSDDGLGGGTKTEVVKTNYDLPYNGTDPLCPIVQTYTRGQISWTEKVGVSKTWYSYDYRGRITDMAIYYQGLNKSFVTSYKYNALGVISEEHYQPSVDNTVLTSESFNHYYHYDYDGRLVDIATGYYKLEAGELVEENDIQVRFTYAPTGELVGKYLPELGTGFEYFYTPEGWLKSVNNPNYALYPEQPFAQTYHYYEGDFKSSTDEYSDFLPHFRYISCDSQEESPYHSRKRDYTGNILAVKSIQAGRGQTVYSEFINLKPMIPLYWTYEYDSKYQLLNASTVSVNYTYGYNSIRGCTSLSDQNNSSHDSYWYFTKDIAYDANGNIKGFNRGGNVNTFNLGQRGFFQGAGADIRDLRNAFQYDVVNNKPNQLTSVTGYATYQYNEIGQMTSATKEGATTKYIYNPAGLLSEIRTGSNQLLHSFTYDENGNRIKKTDHTNPSGTKETWYIYGSGKLQAIYNKDNIGSGTLTQIEVPIYSTGREGVFYRADKHIDYEVKDHTGSVRAILVKNSNSDGWQAENQTEYYPFGLQINAYQTSLDHRYGYQGEYAEDETDETRFNSFQLRAYDPVLGRWFAPDPYGQHWSPYLAMSNNPVIHVDPDGGCDDPPCNTGPGFDESNPINLDVVEINVYSANNIELTTDAAPRFSGSFNDYTWAYGQFAGMTEGEADDYWRVNYSDAWREYERKLSAIDDIMTMYRFAQAFSSISVAVSPSFSPNLASPKSFSLTPRGYTPLTPKIHGNSLNSPKQTWGYKLYAKDGVFLKNGITSAMKAESRYTKSFMSDKYMEKLLFPNRRSAYDWEFGQNQILKGPLNLNMH